MSQIIKAPIGIYGGTFDPIHFGHLRPNLELCELFALEHVRFIPSSIPPHREKPKSSSEQRLQMVASAIESEDGFILDQRELNRMGPSYMIDTLLSLRQSYPHNPLCLLLGMDAFLGLHQWHRWQEILDYTHIIVSQRPDTEFTDQTMWPSEIIDLYQQHQGDRTDIHKQLHGIICLKQVTQLAISSSDIRQRLANKQSIRYLLPETVIDLIEYHQLYR